MAAPDGEDENEQAGRIARVTAAAASAAGSGVGAAKDLGQTAAGLTRRLPGLAKGEAQEEPTLEPLWPRDGVAEFDAADAVAAEEADERLADSLSLGALVLGAEVIAGLDDDRATASRAHRVVAERAEGLFEQSNHGEPYDVHAELEILGGSISDDQRRSAAVELWFVDPVAPFDIAVPNAVRREARWRTLQCLGLSDEEIRKVRGTIMSARRAHGGSTLKRVGLFGLGGAMIFATAGFLAAPVIAASLGAAAGLKGAAATAYGLSLLGGGSLAAGGAGMTGGVWLVTGVGAATGIVGAGGGRAMYELGADQLRVEVIKLQATYRLLMLDRQLGEAKALAVAEGLDARIAQLEEQIEYERAVNDRNSRRVKDLADKLASLRAGRDWMAEQQDVPA